MDGRELGCLLQGKVPPGIHKAYKRRGLKGYRASGCIFERGLGFFADMNPQAALGSLNGLRNHQPPPPLPRSTKPYVYA